MGDWTIRPDKIGHLHIYQPRPETRIACTMDGIADENDSGDLSRMFRSKLGHSLFGGGWEARKAEGWLAWIVLQRCFYNALYASWKINGRSMSFVDVAWNIERLCCNRLRLPCRGRDYHTHGRPIAPSQKVDTCELYCFVRVSAISRAGMQTEKAIAVLLL